MPKPELKSLIGWLDVADVRDVERFLDSLSDHALAAFPYLFEFWALPHQLPPEGGWRNWLLLGGRGAGKTRAGAEWVRSLVEGNTPNAKGAYSRIALIAETYDQAREVMIFGPSGIMACSPPDRRPKWHATRRLLEWPNGAIVQVFSASEPEALRGPQFDAAWCDELAKWKKAEDSWDMLQFALRLGEKPRVMITTTPRNVGVLKRIMDDPATAQINAPTSANEANLSPDFLANLMARYGGSRLGRQELDGVLMEDIEGALWRSEDIEQSRGAKPDQLDRIVVAVDPPVSTTAQSDECGIVVVGVAQRGDGPRDWHGYVLADKSIQGAHPEEWARRAVEAYHDFGADAIIAEVNQGGDLVASVLRQHDPTVPVRKLHAKQSKVVRAEPVATLYRQHRVTHCGQFDELEMQMLNTSYRGYMGQGSPDRLDALVWALNHLILTPLASELRPKLRTL